MRINVSLEEAQNLTLGGVRAVSTTDVELSEALGRIISRDIRAPLDVPPFDRSPLDGYALRAEDTRGASSSQPVVLTVMEKVPAGKVPTKKVTSGTAVKVMTGTPIPEGADVVVPFEDVREMPDEIEINRPYEAGSNIVPMGEDVKKGEVVATEGTRISPPLLGVLASLGCDRVPVFECPKVAIITTGNELTEPGEPLSAGKIYNSNRYFIEARCRELGTNPLFIGNVLDVTGAVASAMEKALNEADLVITTGGVSVGEYDVVKDALKLIGAEIIFAKMALKPGMPTIAGRKEEKLILALSGNPAAASITFELIAVPVMKKMAGYSNPFWPIITGVLANDFPKASPYRRILRARYQKQDKTEYLVLTGEQTNGVLKSMIDCNVLLDVPAGSPPLSAGQEVKAFFIGNSIGYNPIPDTFAPSTLAASDDLEEPGGKMLARLKMAGTP